jgi:hypothetical protein
MSSKEEFLTAFGPPHNADIVSTDVAARARDRLPESLINFWLEYGIGSYADDTLFLCTPDLFDPVVDRLLANVPELRGRLAAFAYTAFGDVLLWHVSQRDFILYLQFAIFDDQTSRQETDPVPDNLIELYRSAGVEPPIDATLQYLENRRRPANLWNRLMGYASTSDIDHELDDDGQPLLRSLTTIHGPLNKDEVYSRRPDPEGFENVAASYLRQSLRDLFGTLPSTVKVSHAVEVNGAQEIITTEYLAGDA